MDYKSIDYSLHNQMIGGSIYYNFTFIFSSGSHGRGGGKKHTISAAAFDRNMFYDLFVQDWGM